MDGLDTEQRPSRAFAPTGLLTKVDHLFKDRINAGFEQSAEYIRQFPSPIIAKIVSFVAGRFAAVLIIVALMDEVLLEAHVYGRNLFWFTVFFGSVTAISRSLVADEYQVFDPEGAMSLVSQHTHYMRKKWRGKEYTDRLRGEFEALCQYIMKKLLEDMVSIFLTPYLLIFLVPKRV
ncbi:autophagy-related protein 9-like [Amborella trichopoda]|uniref:autophagy-related protein 9-like n=1 Tax=Amborella trichopoda TaxID=13333 RepID=UPI0009C0CFA8|nr:autophagy-related protein 9-like [Amborella trichopoda]|eukprot:XP_020518158.1 autophagy-related protein 9-like [Amborella trichopoda]